MKKIHVLFLMLAVIAVTGMTSCNKKETKTTKELLIGKWEMTNYVYDGERGRARDAYITFNENGSCKLDWTDEDVYGNSKWTLSGNELTVRGGDLEDGLWEYDDKTPVDNELYLVVDIEEISETAMEVSGSLVCKDYDYGDTYKYKLRAFFEKVQ